MAITGQSRHCSVPAMSSVSFPPEALCSSSAYHSSNFPYRLLHSFVSVFSAG